MRQTTVRKTFSAVLTLVLLVALGTVALADEVVNDVNVLMANTDNTLRMALDDDPVNVTMTLVRTGSGPLDPAACNVAGNHSLTVSSTTGDTAVASLSDATLTFLDCDEDGALTLTVTPTGIGSTTVSFAATDLNGIPPGAYDLSQANFVVVVGAPNDPCFLDNTATGCPGDPCVINPDAEACGGGGDEEDTTPPDISYVVTPDPALGENGWHNGNVTLVWTVTDAESQSSIVKTGCVDQNITADQQEITYSCSATSEGGSAGPVDVAIKRDATRPDVTVVGAGASYATGSGPTCDTADATSGVQNAATATYAPVDPTDIIGPWTITCTGAKDMAGNTQAVGVTGNYDVTSYGRNGGIREPIAPWRDDVKAFSRGHGVPVKFGLLGDQPNGFPTTGWAAWAYPSKCDQRGEATGPGSRLNSLQGGNLFRYSASGDQYVLNGDFSKRTVGSCWFVEVTLDDGSAPMKSATFKLSK